MLGARTQTEAERMKEYYEKIRENVPNIEELDDEIVDEDFFQNKLSLYAKI